MQIKFRIKSIELSRGFITHLNGRCFVQRTNNQLAAVNYRRHRSHSDQRKPKYSPLWWLRRVWQISQVQSNIQQINVSFSCACPIIDHELRHNIVKEVVDPQTTKGRCLLLLVRTRSAHHASHGLAPRARWGWHRRNQLRYHVHDKMKAKISYCDQIKFNEPVLKPGTPE